MRRRAGNLTLAARFEHKRVRRQRYARGQVCALSAARHRFSTQGKSRFGAAAPRNSPRRQPESRYVGCALQKRRLSSEATCE